MTILYVLNSGSLGGVEVHVEQLVKGFSSKGHRVLVWCPDGEMVDRYKTAGAEVTIESPGTDLDFGYMSRLIQYIRAEGVSLVHLHQLKTVINGLLAIRKQVPTVAHIHSPLSQWRVSWVKKTVNRFVNFFVVNLFADKVIALTEATKQERVRGEGIRPSLIEVIPNGVDPTVFVTLDREQARKELLAQYEWDSDAVLIGVMSRLTEEKGIEVALSGVARLISHNPNIGRKTKLLIAGDGHLKDSLISRAADLGIANEVHFLGALPDEEWRNLYAALDVYLFPSLHEGFGYVLVEAMMSGTITVSSDLAVLQEITRNGTYGYHFRKGDPEDVALQLVKVLERRDQWQSMTDAAREHTMQEYSFDRFISNYGELYDSLVNPARFNS